MTAGSAPDLTPDEGGTVGRLPRDDDGIPMCPCYGRTEVCDQPGPCPGVLEDLATPPVDLAADTREDGEVDWRTLPLGPERDRLTRAAMDGARQGPPAPAREDAQKGHFERVVEQ